MNIKLRYIKWFLILLISIFGFIQIGCLKDNSIVIQHKKELLIQEKTKERLNSFRQRKIKKCKQESLKRAEEYVHQKMIKEFSYLMKDTIVFPQKPIRPPLPENLSLDTIGVDKIEVFKLQKTKNKH